MSKTYYQHRSAKTGRYVTKSEIKKSPVLLIRQKELGSKANEI
jgi:hypothetical protein